MLAIVEILPVQIFTQILGFLIVLWVLKKYAFGPFMKTLDERSDEVKTEYEKIEEGKKEVESLKASYEKHLANIDEEERKKIQGAIKEGEQIAREIQEKARQQAKDIHEKARNNAILEVEKARVTLKEDIITLTLNATEKVLQQKLDEKSHHDLIDKTIRDLENVK